MTHPTKKPASTSTLQREVRALHDMLMEVKSEGEAYRHPVRIAARSFLRGISYVLGGIVTVAIVIPLFLWLLRTVSWPSITAKFVDQVILQMERANLRGQPGADGQ